MMRLRVLVIAEDPGARDRIAADLRLEYPGVEVAQAADERALAEALESGQCDVVFADEDLRWGRGTEVVRRVRERWPGCALILRTGAGPQAAAAAAMKHGLDDYVPKTSHDSARLAATVRAALERRVERRRSMDMELRFQLLFDHAPVGILRATAKGTIREANLMAAEILGVPSPRHLTGLLVQELCGTPGPPAGWFHQVLSGRALSSVETQVVRGDGRTTWARLSARALRDAEGHAHGVELVVDDITERRAERQRLEEIERQLHHAQKMEAVGRLAGGVAHDFNNLLTVILGHASLAQDAMRDGTASPADLAPVLQAARRATELTRQLLALSHAQPGQERIVNPAGVVGETARMLARLIGEDIELVTNVAPDTAPIRIDPGQLGQVLMNLAVNARDAMPQGGRLEVAVRNVFLDSEQVRLLAGLSPGLHACVSIRDTGHGIPEGIRSRIFEPFFTTKEPGVGTGLGLSIVHGIVRKWDGAMRVESAEGEGACFELYFPAAQQDERITAPPRPLLPRGGPETILVTEDDETLRQLVTRSLRAAGYTVLESREGREALELARRYEGSIHLLLTDVVMPTLTGPELASRLRIDRPGLRVVLMSGYAGDLLRRRVEIPDGVRWLEKPFSLDALKQEVRAALDAEPGALMAGAF